MIPCEIKAYLQNTKLAVREEITGFVRNLNLGSLS